MMGVLSVIGWVLLWILLGILGLLLLIVLLLCVPVWLIVDYGDETRMKLRYGLIPITLMPRPEKEPKPDKKDKKKKEKKPKGHKKEKPPKPKKSLPETLRSFGIPDHLPETMDELVKALVQVGRLGNGIRKSLTICRLEISVVCGGEDAAQAAINYGRAWPILSGVEQVLGRVLRLKKFRGQPLLDYTAGQQQWRGSAKLRVVPMRIVACAVHRGVRILLGYRRIRKYGRQDLKAYQQRSASGVNQQKGVKVHEQSGT